MWAIKSKWNNQVRDYANTYEEAIIKRIDLHNNHLISMGYGYIHFKTNYSDQEFFYIENMSPLANLQQSNTINHVDVDKKIIPFIGVKFWEEEHNCDGKHKIYGIQINDETYFVTVKRNNIIDIIQDNSFEGIIFGKQIYNNDININNDLVKQILNILQINNIKINWK